MPRRIYLRIALQPNPRILETNHQASLSSHHHHHLPLQLPSPHLLHSHFVSRRCIDAPKTKNLLAAGRQNPAGDCNAASPTSGFDVRRGPRGAQAPRSGAGVYFALGNVDTIFELPASGVALKANPKFDFWTSREQGFSKVDLNRSGDARFFRAAGALDHPKAE
ncbi:hypothetical protein DFH06DRAFT_1328518 [Mycena polygramma]|nr:hypothetical protein DFH06DRAFT_1328518 [Mycena polygramma]